MIRAKKVYDSRCLEIISWRTTRRADSASEDDKEDDEPAPAKRAEPAPARALPRGGEAMATNE